MKYLLDADLLIKAYDKKLPEAKARLRDLFEDEANSFAITPMITYEVLCGIPWADTDKHTKIKAVLARLESISIDTVIGDTAERFFRYCRHRDRRLRNTATRSEHKFDYFHFIVAKTYGLAIATDNAIDFDAMENAYQDYLNEKS